MANHIDWSVEDANIYIYFVEEGTSVVISDYHLSDSRFSGHIVDVDYDIRFDLVHISSPNWNNYSNWGYDSWDDDYYAPKTRSNSNDSTAVTPAKPVRQFGKKAE